MRIGFVLECQRDGPEENVFTAFIRRLAADNTIMPVECLYRCQNSKAHLLQNAGLVVNILLTQDKCDHVFVVWDARPAWATASGRKVDVQKDRAQLKAALEAANVPTTAVSTICIKHELETWLISDSSAFLNLPYSRGATPGQRRALSQTRPKDTASDMKREIGLGQYLDYVDAELLARHVRFRNLARIDSFCEWFCKLFNLAGGVAKAPFCRCLAAE